MAVATERGRRARRWSPERLRRLLAASAVVLLVVIGGFLFYAHWKVKRFLGDLPGKLGIDIRQTTKDFIYTQSSGSRRLYTIRAAKAIEHANGKMTLHDVEITLYGRMADREDHIKGAEFEYDKNAQVVKAIGEVDLDLQAPESAKDLRPANGPALTPDQAAKEKAKADAHVVHVKTSGLVYLQKLGIAATEQPLTFTMNGSTGHATGAEYNSDDGSVILQSAVQLDSLLRDKPTRLNATHAEYHRDNGLLTLASPVMRSEGRVSSSRTAVVHLRQDSSVEMLDADGDVVMDEPGVMHTTASHGQAHFTADNKAQTAHLSGGVRMEDHGASGVSNGSADTVAMTFDGAGVLHQMVMTGNAVMRQQTAPAAAAVKKVAATADASAKTADRTVSGDVVTLDFLTNAEKKPELRQTHAVGHGHAVERTASAAGAGLTEVAGDDLVGQFAPDAATGKPALKVLDGTGHTSMHQLLPDTTSEMSTGDRLHLVTGPGGVGAKGANAPSISSAVQTGHVVFDESQPATAKSKASVTHGTAAEGVFDGATNHVTLRGDVTLRDSDSVIEAAQVVVDRMTRDATAEGGVRGSLVQEEKADASAQSGGAEPVHVRADRAVLQHASGRISFSGAPGVDARLWQKSEQMEAPLIDYDRQTGKLYAHGRGTETAPAVRTVLLSEGHATAPANGGDKAAAKPKSGNGSDGPQLMRIWSKTADYDRTTRLAHFAGGVRLDGSDGSMRADNAELLISDSTTAEAKTEPAAGLMQGRVEKVTATGNVQVLQPDRRALGERLIYTAADGLFVLTGSPGHWPRITDVAQGNTTGERLEFKHDDKSVTVVGDAASGKRTHLETHTAAGATASGSVAGKGKQQ